VPSDAVLTWRFTVVRLFEIKFHFRSTVSCRELLLIVIRLITNYLPCVDPECSSTLAFGPIMSRLNPVHASTLCFYNQLHHTFRLVDISVFRGTCLAMSCWLFGFTDMMCCSVCFKQFNCLIATGLWIVV